METTVKKIVNLVGGAILACSMLIAPQAGRAQDLRGEIESNHQGLPCLPSR